MNTAGVIHMEDKVKESELIGKVHSAVYHQCQQRGYAAPADVLVDIGVLPKQKYEDWRFGKVRYMEADEEAERIYRELAPQTRWRVGQGTQIEPIRMNALKQLI